MKILDGKLVANHIVQDVLERGRRFKNKYQRSPHLVVILVGDNSASQVYVRNKQVACQKVEIKSTLRKFPESAAMADVESCIQELNQDREVDGILLQLPLPSHLDQKSLLNKISVFKDVDGLTEVAQSLFDQRKSFISPCTPRGIMKMIEFYKVPLQGTKAVVIGKSQIVGKPMAELLRRSGANVAVIDSKTIEPKKVSSNADLVVVAAGRPMFFGKDYFQKGAIVIDVGIHRLDNNKLCGDVNAAEMIGHLGALSPVPGGVGPLTIASLLENTLILAEKRAESGEK